MNITTRPAVLLAVPPTGDIHAAARFAGEEAMRRHAPVQLLSVVHVMATGPERMAQAFPELERLGQDALAAALEKVEDVVEARVPVDKELASGSVTRVIVDRSRAAGLVVLAHRHLGAERFLVGSTSGAVAARAHTPVVSVPTAWEPGPLHRPVTVGIEDPTMDYAVVEAAAREADLRHVALHVLHTWWISAMYDELIFDRTMREDWDSRGRRELEALLDPVRRDHPELRIEVRVQHRPAYQALLEAARESDLLIVGRRDRMLPIGSHLGPVTRELLRESPCPVLVVEPIEPRVHEPIRDHSAGQRMAAL